MLAVPIQGFAAVAMLYCGSGHFGLRADSERHFSAHDHQSTNDVESAEHDAEAVGIGDDKSVKGGQAAANPTAKCSACASCCVGAGLPVDRVSLTLAAPDLPPRSAALGAHAESVTPGLDRPPRLLLD